MEEEGMPVERRVFVGVDVSARKLDVAFVDASGSPLHPPLVVTNDPAGFAILAERMPAGEVLLGAESSSAYHRAVLDFAHERGWASVELNPLTIKRFVELRLRQSRTDRTDANDIAQFLRTFQPKASTRRSETVRELTLVVRSRRRVVDERSRNICRFRRHLGELLPGFTTAYRGKLPLAVVALLEHFPSPQALLEATDEELSSVRTAGGATVKHKQIDKLLAVVLQLPGLEWSEATAATIGQLARRITQAYCDVRELDGTLKTMVQRLAPDSVLHTIPGVGFLTIATILGEVGDIHRFPTVDQFIGYCGLYPASKKSGEGGWSSRMVRKGNRTLRLQILLASTTARRHNPQVKAFYERLCRSKSKSCAGGAAARKFAVQIYAVLKSGNAYDPTR